MFRKLFFILGLVFPLLMFSESKASEEAIELLMKAYNNCGTSPALFHSGYAEFLFRQESNLTSEIKEDILETEKRAANRLSEKQGNLDQHNEKIEIQQLGGNKQKQDEYIYENRMSVLFSGNDCYLAANPIQNKRLCDITSLISNGNSQESTVVDHCRTIQIGGPNDTKTCRRFVWRPLSNFLECSNQFDEKSEFQLFGRIQELPGSSMSMIFRQKLNREDFTFQQESIKFFVQEFKRQGLECEITGEATYDNSEKAVIVNITKNDKVLEIYHIDPSRGYICPMIFAADESGTFSTKCIAKDYFLIEKNKLYYPKEYHREFMHSLIGTTNNIYTVNQNSVVLNQPLASEEFSIDIPKGANVYRHLVQNDKHAVQGQPLKQVENSWVASEKGTISLASDQTYNLEGMNWLIPKDTGPEYAPISVKEHEYVWLRIFLCLAGILMIAYGMYYKWRQYCVRR